MTIVLTIFGIIILIVIALIVSSWFDQQKQYRMYCKRHGFITYDNFLIIQKKYSGDE